MPWDLIYIDMRCKKLQAIVTYSYPSKIYKYTKGNTNPKNKEKKKLVTTIFIPSFFS